MLDWKQLHYEVAAWRALSCERDCSCWVQLVVLVAWLLISRYVAFVAYQAAWAVAMSYNPTAAASRHGLSVSSQPNSFGFDYLPCHRLAEDII